LQRFEPTHPMYDVLVELREQARRRDAAIERRRMQQAAADVLAPTSTPATAPALPATAVSPAPAPVPVTAQKCPYCQKTCGRSIRECAEAYGGRRSLKKLLRILGVGNADEPVVAAGLSPAQEARKDALFAAYAAVSCG
jgi:hypothetical protein